MNCFNPAKKLEVLGDKLEQLEKELPYKPELAPLHHELKDQFDQEFERVYKLYVAFFKKYTLTVNEIAYMLDFSIQYVTRVIVPELNGIYFTKHIRRYIKENYKEDRLLKTVIERNEIDWNKRVFFTTLSLEKWCHHHICTYDKKALPYNLIKYIVSNKHEKTFLDVKNFKEKYGLLYDVQVYRKGRERIYIYNNEDKVSMRRFFADESLDQLLQGEREYIYGACRENK